MRASTATAGDAVRQPGGRVVVIGVGDEFRRDDGAGPVVMRRLLTRVPRHVDLLACDGEPARLEAWAGAALAIVVDTVRAEPPHPGRLHRLVLDRPPGGNTKETRMASDWARRRALALALHRMPGRLIVHAVEAGDLAQGIGLTRPVAAAVDALADAVVREIQNA